MYRRFCEAPGGGGVGPGVAESDVDCCVQAASGTGVDETARSAAAREARRPRRPGDNLIHLRDEAMATVQRPKPKGKHFTLEEANAMLPLLRAILRDVTALAQELRERHQTLLRMQSSGNLDKAHEEEIQQLAEAFERDQDRMREYEYELKALHIELKDYFTGLVDFPCRMNGREVYLCWKLDEPEVAHWHELDAGFAGRQKLKQQTWN